MQEQQAPQGEQQGQGDPMKDMVQMVDQAISQLAEALGSEELAQVQAAFRGAVEKALQGGGGGGQQPSRMQDPHAQGAQVRQAY